MIDTNINATTSSLTQIANRHGTDKGTTIKIPHAYSLIYDMLFSYLRRRSAVRLLEIGLSIGGPELGAREDRPVHEIPSVTTWLDYFSDAVVYGIDVSDFSRFETERFKFFRGDAGNLVDLQRISNGIAEPLDVIIDDASHASYHQTSCIKALFQNLAPGGLYIIEDLHWQPAAYEPQLPKCHKMRNQLWNFFQEGSFLPPIGDRPDCDLAPLAGKIEAVWLFDGTTQSLACDGYNKRMGLHARELHSSWTSSSLFSRLGPKRFFFNAFLTLAGVFSLRQLGRPHFAKVGVLQKSWAADPLRPPGGEVEARLAADGTAAK